MRTFLTLCWLVAGTAALAQTTRKSEYSSFHSSINDDDEGRLSIQIDGIRGDGKQIAYNRTFNVAGWSKARREALTKRVLDSLQVSQPEPPKPSLPPSPIDPADAATGETVTFVCPTCTGKMELLVRGDNYTLIRTADSRKDKQAFFPFTTKLPPGKYRYEYTQNRVNQMQLPFVVKAGQDNVVTVK